MRSITWVATVIFLSAYPLGAAQVVPTRGGDAPSVRIVEPTADTLLVGQVTLRVVVDPPDTRVVSVDFFIDGGSSPACSAKSMPFDCSADVGERIVSHTIRAVANLRDGTRIVTSVLTASGIVDRAAANAVLVPVVVTDYLGRFVKGLDAKSFQVFEDGAPQMITSLQAENVPIDVVIAVDISGSMLQSMPKLKESVKRFLTAINALRRANTPTRLTLVGFNDRAFVVAKPETSLTEQALAVDRLNAFGGTSLYDTILSSIDLLGSDVSRKALIVFTDGDDRSSLGSIAPVQRRIRDSNATVYMITQGNQPAATHARDVVRQLSEVSGGRAFSIEDVDELEKVLSFVIQDLTNQYLMGYSPTNTARDGTYRRITVRTSVKSHQIRAREGYRAPSK
jgi:Ca-activated chloride channel family protein